MDALFASQSIVMICLIVTLEEANVPLPIPGDLLLLSAGAVSAHAPGQFLWWLLLLSIVPGLGAYALYAVVRRGGRPLVERYGRYLAIGPRELATSEALLRRFGWGGLAIGRSIPLVRHAVTIACGILAVPAPTFLLAQLVGGVVNTLIFMLLGALVGPTLVESARLSPETLGVGALLAVAVAVPLWCWRRTRLAHWNAAHRR